MADHKEANVVQPDATSHYGASLSSHSLPVALGVPLFCLLCLANIVAHASDKFRVRLLLIFLRLAMLITGLSMLMTIHSTTNFSTKYAGLYLTTLGSFDIGGNIVCWYVMNLRGHAERSMGSAWMICSGNAGGIVATFAFPTKDSTYYRTGYSVCLATSALCVVSCTSYAQLIWDEKKAGARKTSEGNT